MVIASGKVVGGRVELDSELPEGASSLIALQPHIGGEPLPEAAEASGDPGSKTAALRAAIVERGITVEYVARRLSPILRARSSPESHIT